MKKLTLAAALISAATIHSSAQRLIGVATSNWAGTTSIGLNPASIADSRTRFALDLFSFNLGIDNNLASVNFGNALKSTSGTPDVGDVFKFKKDKAFNVMMPCADVRLPGIMVSINQKHSFAITTKVRMINQFNHFDQQMFRSVMEPASIGSTDYNITSQDFNWTAHVWTELKFTYAREVYNKDEHYLKAGITVNRLGGVGYLSLKGNNLDGTYYAANDSIHTNNTDIEFATNLIDDAQSLSSGLGDVFGQFFGKKGGTGWGADLGVIYEYRPEETNSTDQSSNKYKVRGSLAVTDIGSVKYRSMQARVSADGSMSAADFAQNIQNFNKFEDYARARGYTVDTFHTDTKVHLPTSLVVGVDYYVASHFYVNALWIKNLANRMNFGNSNYGQLSITPRWDTKYFCVALPITYSSMAGSMKAGLGLRAGGFFFGSDDMLAFMGGSYGVNFYVGGYIPINKKNKHKGEKTKASDEE